MPGQVQKTNLVRFDRTIADADVPLADLRFTDQDHDDPRITDRCNVADAIHA